MRITARAATLAEVTALLDREEKAVRAAIEAELGDIVFGVDDESMEVAVAHCSSPAASPSASPSRSPVG